MSEHERLMRIEHKLDAVLFRTKLILYHLLSNRELEEMSKLHDDLDALASGLEAAADRVIAAKTEGESSLADVITRFEATRDKLNAAAADNAASGSSTGAGSGSGRVANDNAGSTTRTDNTGGSTSS